MLPGSLSVNLYVILYIICKKLKINLVIILILYILIIDTN